jgi:hypothetical protein
MVAMVFGSSHVLRAFPSACTLYPVDLGQYAGVIEQMARENPSRDAMVNRIISLARRILQLLFWWNHQ